MSQQQDLCLHCSWNLPHAVWEAVADHLSPNDMLTARLVCQNWKTDISLLVDCATVYPEQLLPVVSRRSSTPRSWARRWSHSRPVSPAVTSDTTPGDTGPSLSSRSSPDVGQEGPSGVRQLWGAFPYLDAIWVDTSSPAALAAIPGVLKQLVSRLDTRKRIGTYAGATGCTRSGAGSSASPAAVRGSSSSGGSGSNGVDVELVALPRTYHCFQSQEVPRGLHPITFQQLLAMLQRLDPDCRAAITGLFVDALPLSPAEWREVGRLLPGMRVLQLPPFKPSISYLHLPEIAGLTQLQNLHLCVEGDFMQPAATAAAFATLSQLTQLTRLTLHAFHAAHAALSSALPSLIRLQRLSLSGRIMLQPVTTLTGLRSLTHLEVTQDVRAGDLASLVTSLTALTHLHVGRVGMAGATAAAAAGGGGEGGAGGLGPVLMHPGDNLLDELGGIVDGLLANLQGELPQHLQQVIQRYEMIMQLDLTRQAASTIWSGPSPADLLHLWLRDRPASSSSSSSGSSSGSSSSRAGGALVGGSSSSRGCGAVVSGSSSAYGGQGQETMSQTAAAGSAVAGGSIPPGSAAAGTAAVGRPGDHSSGSSSSSGRGGGDPEEGSSSSSSSSRQLVSLELAFQRCADLEAWLPMAPAQTREVMHLGLRLRDHLVAYANVTHTPVSPSATGCLAGAFPQLLSLDITGKVQMRKDSLAALLGCQLQADSAPGGCHPGTSSVWGSSWAGPEAVGKGGDSGSSGAPGTDPDLSSARSLPAAAAAGSGPPASSQAATSPAVPSSTPSGAAGDSLMTPGESAVAAAGAAAAGPCSTSGSTTTSCCLPASSPARCLPPRPHCLGAQLRVLSLDMSLQISAGNLASCLSTCRQLRSLTVKHRGMGKVQLQLSALPKTLEHLSCKKVYLGLGPPVVSGAPGSSAGSLVGLDTLDTSRDGQLSLPSLTTPEPGDTSTPGASPEPLSGAVGHRGPGRYSVRSTAISISTPTSPDVTRGGRLSPCGDTSPGPAGLAGAHSSSCSSSSSSLSELLELQLPALHTLVLRNCLVAEGLPAAVAKASRHQLTQLCITGDTALTEVWASWLPQLPRLLGLQVVEAWVPGCYAGNPQQLAAQLAVLPRLTHLQVTSSGSPALLQALTRLTGLRTLVVEYTGPPKLPRHLVEHLADTFPCGKVQVVETLQTGRQGQHSTHSTQDRGGMGTVAAVAVIVATGLVSTGLGYCVGTLLGTLSRRRRAARAQARSSAAAATHGPSPNPAAGQTCPSGAAATHTLSTGVAAPGGG